MNDSQEPYPLTETLCRFRVFQQLLKINKHLCNYDILTPTNKHCLNF